MSRSNRCIRTLRRTSNASRYLFSTTVWSSSPCGSSPHHELGRAVALGEAYQVLSEPLQRKAYYCCSRNNISRTTIASSCPVASRATTGSKVVQSISSCASQVISSKEERKQHGSYRFFARHKFLLRGEENGNKKHGTSKAARRDGDFRRRQ